MRIVIVEERGDLQKCNASAWFLLGIMISVNFNPCFQLGPTFKLLDANFECFFGGLKKVVRFDRLLKRGRCSSDIKGLGNTAQAKGSLHRIMRRIGFHLPPLNG